MKILKIGIMGCANVVQKHIISSLNDIKNYKLVAIGSRNPNKAKEWSKKFKCEYEKSYDDLLKRQDIDVVYIPLPIGLHEKWVIKAANAGKHIICEKSLSDNFSSVKKMVKACEKNKALLYENFVCNYHPQHRRVTSLISEEEIGKILLFKGFFGFPPLNKDNIRYKKSLGGGSLNDAGAYPLFMSRKIMKSEPIYVTCKLFYDKNDVDIHGSAYLEFQGNKSAFISFGFNNMYQNNYCVWGGKGLIKVDRAYSIPPDMLPQVKLIKQGFVKNIEVPAANQFSLMFKDFYNNLLNNKEFKYSHLIAQARVIEALRVSARKNKKICVKDIK